MTRRELRELLPAFAHWFGVMPWHIEPDPPVLTSGEVETFADWLKNATTKDGD